MARQSGLSERQRDPKYKSRNRKKYGSIYGYGPKLSFPGSKSGGGSVGSSGGLPGGIPATQTVVPNIDQILARDPFYKVWAAQNQAQSVVDEDTFNRSVDRAIIDFGYAPPNLSEEAAKVLDPTTRALADKNTASGMSIWARLKDAANIQRRDVVNSIGARGMFNSGETGYGLQRTQLAADQGRYDAIKNLLDYLAGAEAGLAESRRRAAEANAQKQQETVNNWDGSVQAVGPSILNNLGIKFSGAGRIAGKTKAPAKPKPKPGGGNVEFQ